MEKLLAEATLYNPAKIAIIEKYNALCCRRGLGKEFNKRVISLAGDLNGKKVLDAGCGFGELLIDLANFYPKAGLYGVDFSEVRVMEAEKLLKMSGAEIMLKVADIEEHIPFENGFFDVVLCIETLEHLSYPDRCLQEVKRVLKGSGKIIITVPNGSAYWPFVCFGNLVPTKWLQGKLLPYEHPLNTDQPKDTCYRYKEIVELIQRSGLAIEKIKGWRYFRYLQLLPVIRDMYRLFYPFVSCFFAKIKWERFAYNLFFECRK